MFTELLQFAAAAGVFAVVAAAWLFVVYIPGRTMEDWNDKRPKQGSGEEPKPP